MDALRDYSPSISDEEVTSTDNGSKSHNTVNDDDRRSGSSSPSPPRHDSRGRRDSPVRHKRSRSPRPHHRRHSRSPPRHKRTSRSPPSRRNYKESGSYRPHRRSPPPGGSGSRSHDRHRRRDSSDYRRSEDDRSYRRASERRDHTHHHNPSSRAPTWSSDGSLTPEQKLEQALATSNKPQQAAAAVGLPKYINPSVINPHHFKAVQEKRKLLWGKKKEKQQEPSSAGSWNKWEAASFEGDDKGETQMKFRRLMGIKDSGGGSIEGGEHKSNKLLDNLEAQYEASRFMTHLAKGAGLGYGSNASISQNKVNPNDTDDINESSHHR